MSHNARSSDVFNTRYSLIIKMHHNKYHWMRMVQAIIQRLQDVYKRQGWAWTDADHLELNGYTGEAIGADDDLVAVSYTHLDVYKRQI